MERFGEVACCIISSPRGNGLLGQKQLGIKKLIIRRNKSNRKALSGKGIETNRRKFLLHIFGLVWFFSFF